MSPSPSEPTPARQPNESSEASEAALVREVIRLNRNVLGLTLGILFAVGLFFATNLLVLKGGTHVGAHLQLLNQFFPGYSVTLVGSCIGAAYAFIAGYVSGWIIATVYNRVVLLRYRP